MGRPTPMPPEFGDDCDKCDDVLWNPHETPKFCYATFDDVETCPGAPHEFINYIYVLEQHPTQPCEWRYTGPDYSINYYIGDASAGIEVRDLDIAYKLYFSSTGKPKCGTSFDNDQTSCTSSKIGKNGSCEINWPVARTP